MPSYMQCKVSLPHSSGLPEYAIVNTFALSTIDTATRAGAADEWTASLDAFYAAFKNYISSEYPISGLTYEYIDMGDAKPRVPYQTDTTAVTNQASTLYDQPPEVALCLSFRGATGSGLNAKRRRGRVYIGPLQVAAADGAVPATALVDLISTAAANLHGLTYAQWCVFSRYTFHGVPVGDDIAQYPDEVPSLLDDAFVPVVAWSVDNAWDTQRRRGKVRTYRASGP